MIGLAALIPNYLVLCAVSSSGLASNQVPVHVQGKQFIDLGGNQSFNLLQHSDYEPLVAMAGRLTLPRSIFNRSLIDSIHKLWFVHHPPTSTVGDDTTTKNWFGLGATAEEKQQFDAACTKTTLEALNAIGPDKWSLPRTSDRAQERHVAGTIATPFAEFVAEEGASSDEAKVDAALSLMVLLDQMPRNLFRKDQGKIYAHYDRLARAMLYTMRGLNTDEGPAILRNIDDHGRYRASALHRIWFCMPLMHSEYIEDHEELLNILHYVIDECVKNGDMAASESLRKNIGFEEKHRVIIEKFGRYPYRNKWLDRETTKEETEWIEGGGDTFSS